jgi:uracil-DNA glycosylase family 4
MLSKPPSCKLCRLSYVATGYAPDQGKADAKLAIVLDSPQKGDILDEGFWRGAVGRSYEKKYLAPVGLTRADVIISAAIRCRPAKGDWPSPESLGKIGASCCRQYDDLLRAYMPDLAIASFGVVDVTKTPALYRLVIAALEKAMRFRERGFRPVVLMGGEATRLVMPFTGGGMKKWQGHYSEINGWPFEAPQGLVQVTTKEEEDDTPPWEEPTTTRLTPIA